MMRKIHTLHATAVVWLTLTALPAATVVYDNHIPATSVGNGRTNDPDFPIYIEHADNFSLPAAATVNGVTWHGLYEDNVRPDDFSLRVYALGAGLPVSPPLADVPLASVVREDTGVTITYSLRVYSYCASFDDISLGAGSYALSIYNRAADGAEWLWATRDNPAVDGSFMRLGTGAWKRYSGGPEFSFTLTQVPEPGVALAVAAWLPCLLVRRRRD